MGYLAPANEDQPRDLILFDKKGHPRDAKGRPVFGALCGSDTPVCGSKKRGKEAYCANEGRMENGRCKNHGGRSLKGAASPTYKDGSTSKFRVAGHLLERFERYLADPELHHHRTSIAQIDAMVDELWENYQSGIDPDLASKLGKTFRAIEAANAANNRIKAMELFEALGQLIGQAETSSNQSEKIVRFLEARRRHADSESRRKLAESLVFSLEEAYTYYTALGTAVRKHVESPEVRGAIVDEVAAIAGSSGAIPPSPKEHSHPKAQPDDERTAPEE